MGTWTAEEVINYCEYVTDLRYLIKGIKGTDLCKECRSIVSLDPEFEINKRSCIRGFCKACRVRLAIYLLHTTTLIDETATPEEQKAIIKSLQDMLYDLPYYEELVGDI